MPGSAEEIKAQVHSLLLEGIQIQRTHIQKNPADNKAKKTDRAGYSLDTAPTARPYQIWYTKTLPIIRQLLPERYKEFQDLYRTEAKGEQNYSIHDFLIGILLEGTYSRFESNVTFLMRFQTQLMLLESAESRIDFLLSDIQGTLQAEMFDDEIDAAEELFKKGHLRAAGTLAGVTLERHLAAVLANHDLKLAKKSPTIADLNNELKTQGVYDVPDWRFIERLGDIRNLSAHSKEREPTKVEVSEMIEGVKKVIKTIF